MPDSVFEKVAPITAQGAQQVPAPAQEEATPPKPEETAEYWKSRFDGANRKINELVGAGRGKESTLAQYAEKLSTAEGTAKEIEMKLQALEGEYKGTLSKLQEAELKAATLDKSIQRMNLVSAEFPHLAQYQAKGLLRGDIDDPEAFKTYLNEFDSTIRGAQKAAVNSQLAGVLPSTGPQKGDDAPDREILWAKMDALIKAGNYKEAETLEKQFVEAGRKK